MKRDLSEVPPSEVVFDDLCGLQEYFDALKDESLAPPTETFANDIGDEKSAARGGRKRFRFENDFQLHYLRRLLDSNWKAVPMEVAKASIVEVEVAWSQKAGVARVATTEEAFLTVGPKTWALPYHVCLSDFLFGETLYDTRRAMLQLPGPDRNRFSSNQRVLGRIPVQHVPTPAGPAGAPEPMALPIPTSSGTSEEADRSDTSSGPAAPAPARPASGDSNDD